MVTRRVLSSITKEDEVPRETRQREHLNRDQIAGGQTVPMRL